MSPLPSDQPQKSSSLQKRRRRPGSDERRQQGASSEGAEGGDGEGVGMKNEFNALNKIGTNLKIL